MNDENTGKDIAALIAADNWAAVEAHCASDVATLQARRRMRCNRWLEAGWRDCGGRGEAPLARALRKAPEPLGGAYRVGPIEPEPTTRSGKQHRFYHAFMGKWAAVSELGYTHAELHELMKFRHNAKLMLVDGEELKIGQTTTKLSVEAMTAYIENVMQDAATWDSFLMPASHRLKEG